MKIKYLGKALLGGVIFALLASVSAHSQEPVVTGAQDGSLVEDLSSEALKFYEARSEIPELGGREISDTLQNSRAVRSTNRENSDKVRRRQWLASQGKCEGDFVDQHPDCRYVSVPGATRAIIIPKTAVPFQAQIVTTETFANSRALKRKYPKKDMWELRHVCGGSLISSNWVVTAAHCLTDNPKAEDFAIRLDAGDISKAGSTPLPIKRIIPHPDFARRDLKNDIALIELETNGENLIQSDDPRMSGTLMDLRLIEDRQRVVSLTHNGLLQLYDPGTNIIELQLDLLPEDQSREFNIDRPRSTTLDESGKYAVVNTQKEFQVFDILAGRTIYKEATTRRKEYVKVDHFRKEVMVVDSVLTLKIVDLNRIKPTKQINIGVVDVKNVYRLTDDKIAVVNFDTYQIWDLSNSRKLGEGKARAINSVEWDALNNTIQVVGYDDILLLDSKTGSQISKITRRSGYGRSGQLNRDARQFVRVEYPNKAKIYRLSDGKLLHELKIGLDGYSALTFDRDRRLLVWDEDGKAEIWNVKKKKRLKSFEAKFEAPNSVVQVVDNGRKLFIGEKIGRSQIWDLKKGKRLHLNEHSVSISEYRLQNDEGNFITLSDFGTVELWDLKAGKAKVRVFHDSTVSGGQLLGDKRSLMTWDRNGRVKIWDINKGTERNRYIATLPGGAIGSTTEKPRMIDTVEWGSVPVPNEDDYEDDYVRSFGWGKTYETSEIKPSALLGMVSLTVLTKDQCLALTNWSDHVIHDGVFCANDMQRKTCYGDSGGPVIVTDDETFENKLVGVVSWGSGKCDDDNIPSVYTRISNYDSWIRQYVCPVNGNSANRPRACGAPEFLPMRQ